MKPYTKEEIRKILEETAGVRYAFGDADRERVLADPILEESLASLIAYGEKLDATPTLAPKFSAFARFDTDGDRSEYEEQYFERRARLVTYTILVWLYGKREDIVSLENIVWTILDEYTWVVPAHLRGVGLTKLQEDGYTIDLFAAETGEALAEMLSIVGDRISPIVKMRTERYIKERILDRATEPFGWNTTMTNNWVAVCGGSVGMTAIYQEKDLDRLSEILSFLIGIIRKNFYKGFSADGACLEGLAYWNYGFGYFTYFADLLKRRTAGKIDLFADEPIKDIALFYQKCFFKDGRTVGFADGGSRSRFQPALAAYFLDLYPGEWVMPPMELVSLSYPQDHCFRFALLLRNFTFAAGKLPKTDTDLTGTYLLPSAQWYLSSAENGVGIAAKGGHNNEPHNHNDIGSFQLFKNGKTIIADIGCPAYDKDYFGPLRYEKYFAASSRSHSVPVINGTYQVDGAEHRAECVSLTEDGIRMDIAKAYDVPALSSLVRKLDFCRTSGEVTLTDSFVFTEAPSSLSERFIFEVEPKIQDGVIAVENDGESMKLVYDSIRFTPVLFTEEDLYHGFFGKKRMTYVVDLVANAPEASMTYTFRMIN